MQNFNFSQKLSGKSCPSTLKLRSLSRSAAAASTLTTERKRYGRNMCREAREESKLSKQKREEESSIMYSISPA